MSSDHVTTPTPAAAAGPLDARPAVSAPDALSPAAAADARRSQPRRGLIGLAFVIPVTLLLAVGADGPVHSLLVFGPIITFALPIIAVIAFWWEDWPGSLLPRPWAGLYDTAIVVVGGLVLTVLGYRIAVGGDLAGIFLPGPTHPPAFPSTVALSGGVFTITLQVTLVCERWPFDRLGRVRSGIAAFGVCWLLGLAAYVLVVRSHLVPSENYGAWQISVALWQMLWYVALRGWPFARIHRRAPRLILGNAVVIGCGWATYLLFDDGVGWPPNQITAVCGTGIASVVVVSMLFEAWPAIKVTPLPGRTIAVLMIVVLTALLSWGLPILANALGVPSASDWSWTTHAALNCLSTAVILHVAVWRRWPGNRTSEP